MSVKAAKTLKNSTGDAANMAANTRSSIIETMRGRENFEVHMAHKTRMRFLYISHRKRTGRFDGSWAAMWRRAERQQDGPWKR